MGSQAGSGCLSSSVRALAGAEFTFYADRLLNFLIEQGISALPTEEEVRVLWLA